MQAKIIATFAVLAFCSPSSAALIKYDVSGPVVFKLDPHNHFPDAVPDVSEFSGSFTYDTSLSGAYDSSEKLFRYVAPAPSSPLGIVVESEGYQFISNPAEALQLLISNNREDLFDEFLFHSEDVLGYDATGIESFVVVFDDMTQTALSDFSIPSALTLADWQFSILRVLFHDLNGLPGETYIDFQIETLTLLPEPNGGVMLLIAGVALAGSRRATRQ